VRVRDRVTGLGLRLVSVLKVRVSCRRGVSVNSFKDVMIFLF